MARADSHDLRREAAARYRIGVATAIRWAVHAAVTGETEAKRQGRPPGSKLAPSWLQARRARGLPARPDRREGRTEGPRSDITLAEMQVRLGAERGVSVGLGTLWRFLDGRAITWKSRRTRPSRTAPTWRRRARRGSRLSPTSTLSA